MSGNNENFQANGARALRRIKAKEVREKVHLQYREELEKAPLIRRYLFHLKIQFIVRKELHKTRKDSPSKSAVYLKNRT